MDIKVCGLKHQDNIEAVSALGPGYAGFIFYEPSPRFAGQLPVEAVGDLPAYITKTAVFVDESAETINGLLDKYPFDAIQLHGNEPPDFCRIFKDKVIVIKAFGVDENFDFSLLNAYVNAVDFFLFDTKTTAHGGSGNTFDWNILNYYQLNVPFFLSGGLSLENLDEIKQISHPQFYGVDLNSRFETAPGMKDINKLAKAFDIIKQTTDK